MSKHTDTGRAGKKLWILIPVIAVLIIAAALVWLNSVYVYAAFRRKGIFVCASSCRTAKYTGMFPSAAR